jgi:hypothetical protein
MHKMITNEDMWLYVSSFCLRNFTCFNSN